MNGLPSSNSRDIRISESLLDEKRTVVHQSSSAFISSILPRILFFIFITFSAVVVAVLSIFLYTLFGECTTRECVLTAASIDSKMDRNIDPCQDFYRYACGGWINKSININYKEWNSIHETTMNTQERMLFHIIQAMKSKKNHLTSGEKAAVEFVRQCTNVEQLKAINLSIWKQFADDLGGWMPELKEEREAAPLEVFLLQSLNYSAFPFFWVGVEMNNFDTTRNVITIDEQLPLLTYPPLYRNDKDVTAEQILNKQCSKYLLLLFHVGIEMSELLGMDSSQPSLQLLVAEMVRLDWLITVSGYSLKEPEEHYELLTLKELQIIAPALDWTLLLSSLVGESLTNTEAIAIKPGSTWISALSDIIRIYSATTKGQIILRNYAKWKNIFLHLTHTKVPCEKRQHIWGLVEMYTGYSHQRKEYCMMRASGIFPLSLPSILRKIEGKEKAEKNIAIVKRIADNIVEEYERIIRESQIPDEQMKLFLIEKITNATFLISYPDKMNDDDEVNKESHRIQKDFFWSMSYGASSVYKQNIKRLREPVDPRDWVDTKPAISSIPIYNRLRNLVQLPYDLMQEPLVHVEHSEVIKYGSIGSIIGHELTHGFDRNGIAHGKSGNLREGKWTNISKKYIKKKEECYLQQFAKVEDMAAADKALYENIGDSVGLEVSLQAWRRHRIESIGNIVGLSLTSEQLFFIGYAQNWCALPGKPKGGVHMNEEFRVIGTLQNSESFSKAFSCPVGSPMNPSNKCTFW